MTDDHASSSSPSVAFFWDRTLIISQKGGKEREENGEGVKERENEGGGVGGWGASKQ